MSYPSIAYQLNPAIHQVNATSTYQPPPQAYPVPHTTIPMPYQAHPQGNQVILQEQHPSPNGSLYINQARPSTPFQQDHQAPLIDLSPPLQQETHANPNGPLYINQTSPSYPMQDPITFDKGDTNLEWPPPSNHMLTNEPTSPIPTPSCDPIPSPLIHQPSKPPSPPLPSSPCHTNPSPKDAAEIVLQRMLEEKLIELPEVKPCEESPYDEHDYCAYHKTKGHNTNKCLIFVPIVYKVYLPIMEKHATSSQSYVSPPFNPNPSNPISPQPNPNPKLPTPSTIIIHPLYFPSTHTLAKDVIHWLLARNKLPPCQTPIHEPIKELPKVMSKPIVLSCDLQAIKPICEPSIINPSQESSCSHVVDQEPIQESSTSIQATQEVCQRFNPKHVETLSPSPTQYQNTFMEPIHNIYLLYDQDDTYEEAIHEHLDPIHNPISIHEQDIHIALNHPPSSPIHNEQTSTCHDETYVPQASTEDQTNNLDQHEHKQDSNDPPSTSTIDSTSNPLSCPIGLTTLIHECSSLGQQRPLSTSPSSNNELKSNVQSTPSPIVHRMLQNMNYKGKGLGLYGQGILEPNHVKIPLCSYGLGHTPQGKQGQDVGNPFMHHKPTTFHRTPHLPKTYVANPPPSTYKPQKHVTIHLLPSTLPPLLPTPNIPPSTLPPLLPTPNIPIIHKYLYIPNHDQQKHTSFKHKASNYSIYSTHPMGFKSKNFDASTYKAKSPTKNPKESHALGHKHEKLMQRTKAK